MVSPKFRNPHRSRSVASALRVAGPQPSRRLLAPAVFLSLAAVRFWKLASGGAGTYFGRDSTMSFGTRGGMTMMAAVKSAAGSKGKKRLAVATWNIAAINNNPFEYWITYKENPKYEELMISIEKFLDEPGDEDVKVGQVFTEKMFASLDSRLTGVGWSSVRKYWESDFKDRAIVSGFMKDKELGLKRLASMPDRITNTINVEGGGQVYRPTVINMYGKDLSSLEKWWKAWESFMFDETLRVKQMDKTSGAEVVRDKRPYEMLQKIKKAKYPAITEEEEADSLPLQTMCGAIFDAILVHMMNVVSTPDVWQDIKMTMVDNLNKKKVPHTLQILERTYSSADVVALQEVSSAFIDEARASPVLSERFHVVAPAEMDYARDQNSVILLSRETFPAGAGREITSAVHASFPPGAKVPVATGDILAVTARSADGDDFVVASFHGDTNGLATKPVLDAVVAAVGSDSSLSRHRLVFGMDANTYESATPGKQQDVMEFGSHYVSKGLTSCWGDVPQPGNYTTYNARTFLQPQLNKACKSTEKRERGDVNPKDFILFSPDDYSVVRTWKDNTGRDAYLEDTAFPTLEFPSDHGILATVLEPKS